MDLRLNSAILLWLLLVGIALFPLLHKGSLSRSLWWKTFAAFAATLALALPLWRLPSLLYNGEINVDESQILAQALKYLADPLPWRSVVGGSGGPINTWVLLWAPLFGLKLSYLAARITSLLCAFATLTGCALALREIAGSRLALLLTLPAAFLLLSTLNFDFLHFSSEQFPAVLCAWTVYLLAKQCFSTSRIRSFLIGFFTGAFPFTKIQVAPAGILLFLLGTAILCRRPASPSTSNRSSLLVQALGGLTVPALILGPVALAGAWGDFMEFYIRSGLQYSNASSRISTLDFLFKGAPDFSAFLTVIIAASAGALLIQCFRRPKAFSAPANLLHGAGLLSLFGILLYGIVRAGFGFPHYLMHLVVPSTLAAGWFASHLLSEQYEAYSPAPEAILPPTVSSSIKRSEKAKASKRKASATTAPSLSPDSTAAQSRRLGVGIAIAAVLLCLIQSRSTFTIYSKNQLLLAPWGQENSPIADALKQMANPGDSLCIWGWYPKLHVFSQLRPATRFAAGSLPAVPDPEHNPTLRAFLSDVQASKPAFFVDASDEFVFPGAAPDSQPRHYSFPEFARWVQSEYTLIGSPQTHPSRRPVLIYKRK